MSFHPIDFSSFISPAHVFQSNADIGGAVANARRATETERHNLEEEGRLKDEFKRTADQADTEHQDLIKKQQQDFQQTLDQHKQEGLKFALAAVAADPTKGEIYFPYLESLGVSAVPKEDGTVEFIGKDGQPVAAPPPAAPQGPAMASTDMDGNPVGPQAPPFAIKSSQMPMVTPQPMPGQPASAVIAQTPVAADIDPSKYTGEPGEQMATMKGPQVAPPKGALAGALQQYAGAPDAEEATSDARINAALSGGGELADQGEPPAEVAPKVQQATATAEATAQAAVQQRQHMESRPGRSFGSIDIGAMKAADLQGARDVIGGFAKALHPDADKAWIDGVANTAVTEHGINTPEKAMAFLQDPAKQMLISWGNQRAGANRPVKGPATTGRGEVLDYEVGRKSVGSAIDSPEMKKVQLAAMNNQKLIQLAEKGKQSTVADSMLQRAFALTMNSGSLSDKDAGAPERLQNWKQQADTFIAHHFEGHLSEQERAEMWDVIQKGQENSMGALQNAYESEIQGLEMASPDSADQEYQRGVVRGMAERYGRYPFFDANRVRSLAGAGGLGPAPKPKATLEDLQKLDSGGP
jgi:hypothetical protein